MKRTVLELLRTAAQNFPDTHYVSEKTNTGWQGKTYPQVDEESKLLAIGLMAAGIKRNDKVSLLSEGRANWIVAEFSVLKAGAVVVPLSIKLLPEEIAFRVNHSESKAIIVSSNVAEKVISAWTLFNRQDVKFIYLDENVDYLQKLADKYKTDISSQLILFSDLLKQGKEALPSKETEINALIDSIQENDTVSISYTSGTTGNPKGIMLTQLNYHENSRDAVEHFRIPAGISSLVILPLDHSFAHTVGIYSSLVCGLRLYFVDSRGSAMAALKNIPINLKEVNPDFLLTVPALTGNFMAKIQEGIEKKGGFVEKLFYAGIEAGMKINKDGHKKAGLLTKLKLWPTYMLADLLIFKKVRSIFGNKLLFCVGGGALLDTKQQHFYYALGIPIYQGYGLSEASPIISANTPAEHKMGTSGKILPTIVCKILNDNGQEVPKGRKGEIVLKGLNVMKGYFRNPDATAETIRGEWLHTGDLGYCDNDGFLVVTGRAKALLISQDGEKYSPEGIEEAIQNCSPMINQVMLYNDHCRFTSALVTLNTAAIEKEIKLAGISGVDNIINLVKDELHRFKTETEYKGQFAEKWIPNTFIILEDAFTEQNLMINSTLKMVRHKITETYKDKIDYLYNTAGAENLNAENRKVVKRLFGL